MKKKIALFLVCFLLVMVPVRGYAVEPVIFGIGEEIILPFLLSLLGVQAKETIGTYQDLKEYHETIKGSLIESLAGLAGMEQVQEWLFKVVNGVIETDSVVWQKLREIAIESFVSAAPDVSVPSGNVLSVPSFNYNANYSGNLRTTTGANPESYDISSCNVICFAEIPDYYVLGYVWVCSSSPIPFNMGSSSTYTYNNQTVYYTHKTGTGSNYQIDFTPDITSYNYNYNTTVDKGSCCWLSVYGGYGGNTDAVASYSDAFADVLTAEEKEDLVDGSNVIQLYNPAELQNGLEIVPGGDPEDDPNLKKIPFAVTADWWNFLQQFGSGDNSNQYVNAYNALNGLDQGTSIGRISDAWDSLGIASVGAAAAQAAEGILNLTDSNIYPQSQSVADTITNSIPSNLTPETPDSGIDNDSPQGLYKLPDLREYFPFCIPFDLINLLSIFVAEPETPEFVIALSTGWSYAEENVSLDQWNGIANMVRNIELAVFVLGLILITRNIIRG